MKAEIHLLFKMWRTMEGLMSTGFPASARILYWSHHEHEGFRNYT